MFQNCIFLHCTGEGKVYQLIKTGNNNHLPKKSISILTSVGTVLYHIIYQDLPFDFFSYYFHLKVNFLVFQNVPQGPRGTLKSKRDLKVQEEPQGPRGT